MSRSLDDLDPDLHISALKLQAAAHILGIKIGFSHTRRTDAEQDILYAQGRTEPGDVVTHRKGGESTHNYGLAFDVFIVDPDNPRECIWDDDDLWDCLGAMGKAMGLEWGGDWSGFRDAPHFQLYGGPYLATLEVHLQENGIEYRGRA